VGSLTRSHLGFRVGVVVGVADSDMLD
jgi:hypothetical protein